jgi:hypothetical protein
MNQHGITLFLAIGSLFMTSLGLSANVPAIVEISSLYDQSAAIQAARDAAEAVGDDTGLLPGGTFMSKESALPSKVTLRSQKMGQPMNFSIKSF